MPEELPEIGKISPEIFQELIYPRLGAKNKNILVGPQNEVVSLLRKEGIASSIVGEVVDERQGIKLIENGREKIWFTPELTLFGQLFIRR